MVQQLDVYRACLSGYQEGHVNLTWCQVCRVCVCAREVQARAQLGVQWHIGDL